MRAPAIVVTALLLLGACGIAEEAGVRRVDPDDVPFELLEPAPTTTSAPPPRATSSTVPMQRITIHLVRNDRIVPVQREVSAVPVPRDLLTLLAQPLAANETAAGYRSLIPSGRPIASVSLGGGIAEVDLTAAFTEAPPRSQPLAFAQMTYTLTELPGVGLVSFTLNGSPVEVPGGEGSIVSGPVSRDTYRNLVA
jgi:spore germination protein GerM